MEEEITTLASRINVAASSDSWGGCLEVFRVFGAVLVDLPLSNLLISRLDPTQLGNTVAVCVLVATNIQDKDNLLPARAEFREQTLLLLLAEGDIHTLVNL